MERFLICGLGNPGERYRSTRHNIGFEVVDALAQSASSRWRRRDGNRDECRRRLFGEEVVLVKPLTYMNLSGEALVQSVTEAGVSLKRILVVCDDIALPLERVRLRKSGSDGGHNGLKSVAYELDTLAFPRLRLGVGPVHEGRDAADFVLDRFEPDETAAAERLVKTAVACVKVWLEAGIDRAMSRFNSRPEDPEIV